MISRILSAFILLYLLGYALFVVLLPKAADDRRTDGIVVLTGGAKRLERGLDLLARGRADRLLISGVDRTVRPRDLARRYNVNEALFKCCIDLGRESVDTRSNGVETARWVKRRKLKTIRLVTTDWHMPRARFELSRQLGDDVMVLSDAVESEANFRALFIEYNKYLLSQASVIAGI
jgi:uncharacterized SAM-binding protein YcdF (DUF218 family)